MTQDDIIRMALEAGIEVHGRKQQARVGIDALTGDDSTEKLTCFAALVAAAEREACAQVCDRLATEVDTYPSECAAAIRARGEKGKGHG